MMAAMTGAPRLGELLQGRGLINEDQLCVALMEQNRSGRRLGAVLVAMGFVSEAIVRDTLGECLGQVSIDLDSTVADPAALAMVPVALARRLRLLPIAWDAQQARLQVAMADPTDLPAQDQLVASLAPGVHVEPLVAAATAMEEAIERSYGFDTSIKAIVAELESGKAAPMDDGDRSHPLVRLVDALLADAVRRGASDIHLEPEQGFLRLRYRIDGVLRQIRALHSDYWPGMTVRIKLLAGMNIAEARAPQDGRFGMTLAGRAVDFRVASLPVLHGENIVIRVLDCRRGLVPLSQLAPAQGLQPILRQILSRPQGLILVTGPTGSGKTTTLYSMLDAINCEAVNIMTLEDPVEYPLPMVRQSMLNRAVKMDFAGGVRAILRQDPDAILIGEIRDEQTAAMALRAAMTGHQVFATLHSNSAVGAIARLEDLGIRRGIMAENITAIIAQRLVRRLCVTCRRRRDSEELLRSCPALQSLPDLPAHVFDAGACEHCERQGYRGRMAIMEALQFDVELEQRLLEGGGGRALQGLAQTRGFVPLADNALRAVLSGLTSLAEIRRVIAQAYTLEQTSDDLDL